MENYIESRETSQDKQEIAYPYDPTLNKYFEIYKLSQNALKQIVLHNFKHQYNCTFKCSSANEASAIKAELLEIGFDIEITGRRKNKLDISWNKYSETIPLFLMLYQCRFGLSDDDLGNIYEESIKQLQDAVRNGKSYITISFDHLAYSLNDVNFVKAQLQNTFNKKRVRALVFNKPGNTEGNYTFIVFLHSKKIR